MTPTGFSTQVEGLRLAWDATCLKSYMRDPLAYYWGHVLGYRTLGRNPKMEWGTLYHEAVGHLEKQIFYGIPQEVALADTIQRVIPAAFEAGLPARGEVGESAKRCVYSVVRAVIWWVEEFRGRALAPLALADGTPALEFNFVVPLGMKAFTGEDYLLVGNIDKIGCDEEGRIFGVERKTTTSTLGGDFMQQYNPSMQLYIYDLVCSAVFPSDKFRGVLVEACQTAVGFTRFDRYDIIRTRAQRGHWEEVVKYWVKRAEEDCLADRWKLAVNTETSTFRSSFKEIQKRNPLVWDSLLAADMSREPLWNPLVRRPPLLGE